MEVPKAIAFSFIFQKLLDLIMHLLRGNFKIKHLKSWKYFNDKSPYRLDSQKK